MKKTFLLLLIIVVHFSYGGELPFSAWKKFGPNDKIANGHLILDKRIGDKRRPEIFQYISLVKGEKYSITFLARCRVPGIALRLNVDFAKENVHLRFKPVVFNTIWHPYKYTFTAGGEKARITFLIQTQSDIPFYADVKDVFLCKAGMLFDPPSYIKKTDDSKIILGSYDIIPEKIYLLKMNFVHKKNWQMRFLDFDEKEVGESSGNDRMLNRKFKMPLRTASVQLILSGASSQDLEKVSLQKLENQGI
ncbi:MAG: DUF642 domain-containing protein [Lentisphaeria bacterium]